MIRPRPLHTAVGVIVGIALAGGGYALAASTTSEIHACASTKTRVLTLQAKCPRGSRPVVWSVRGRAGRVGTSGKNGANGTNGTSVTLNPAVNVTEVSPSTPASAAISQGSGGQDTLHLNIPQGATGAAGAAGASMRPNAYGEIWVGSTAAQLAPGSGAGVANVVGGTGSASIKITNCAAPTPTEPVITVTPNKDTADTLVGANQDPSGLPTAYVSSFDDGNAPGDHVVEFSVDLHIDHEPSHHERLLVHRQLLTHRSFAVTGDDSKPTLRKKGRLLRCIDVHSIARVRWRSSPAPCSSRW